MCTGAKGRCARKHVSPWRPASNGGGDDRNGLVRLALLAWRTHGRLENVAAKTRAHAFDDLVIEQPVSLSFAAEHMPLTPPTVPVLGAGGAALAHPPELARRNHFSHPEAIASGFVSPHPPGLLILLAVFREAVPGPTRS